MDWDTAAAAVDRRTGADISRGPNKNSRCIPENIACSPGAFHRASEPEVGGTDCSPEHQHSLWWVVGTADYYTVDRSDPLTDDDP